MGCDIHIVVERKREDGAWERVWKKNYTDDDCNIEVAENTPERFDGRNYDLFGILADVRNGHGFAGVATGSGWPSIAPARGIPDDSTLTHAERDDYTVGDHSFTWVDLDELKAFDWDGTVATAFGVVTREEYTRMQMAGETVPSAWCGGISGGGVLVVTPDELLKATAPIPFTHVQIAWKETAREGTGDWAGEVLPWLDSLADGQPLRLVFGFDS